MQARSSCNDVSGSSPPPEFSSTTKSFTFGNQATFQAALAEIRATYQDRKPMSPPPSFQSSRPFTSPLFSEDSQIIRNSSPDKKEKHKRHKRTSSLMSPRKNLADKGKGKAESKAEREKEKGSPNGDPLILSVNSQPLSSLSRPCSPTPSPSPAFGFSHSTPLSVCPSSPTPPPPPSNNPPSPNSPPSPSPSIQREMKMTIPTAIAPPSSETSKAYLALYYENIARSQAALASLKGLGVTSLETDLVLPSREMPNLSPSIMKTIAAINDGSLCLLTIGGSSDSGWVLWKRWRDLLGDVFFFFEYSLEEGEGDESTWGYFQRHDFNNRISLKDRLKFAKKCTISCSKTRRVELFHPLRRQDNEAVGEREKKKLTTSQFAYRTRKHIERTLALDSSWEKAEDFEGSPCLSPVISENQCHAPETQQQPAQKANGAGILGHLSSQRKISPKRRRRKSEGGTTRRAMVLDLKEVPSPSSQTSSSPSSFSAEPPLRPRSVSFSLAPPPVPPRTPVLLSRPSEDNSQGSPISPGTSSSALGAENHQCNTSSSNVCPPPNLLLSFHPTPPSSPRNFSPRTDLSSLDDSLSSEEDETSAILTISAAIETAGEGLLPQFSFPGSRCTEDPSIPLQPLKDGDFFVRFFGMKDNDGFFTRGNLLVSHIPDGSKKSATDKLKKLKINSNGLACHGGFYDIWEQINKGCVAQHNTDTVSYIYARWKRRALGGCRRIVLVGHSMGACLTCIAAYQLVKRYPELKEKICIINLGSPLFARKGFCDWIEDNIEVLNICLVGDPTVSLPGLPFAGWYSPGRRLWISPKGVTLFDQPHAHFQYWELLRVFLLRF